MTKEILYATAIDDGGNLVHINDAEKGKDYYCPSCKGKFILKRSGNTGKGSKRPHFAHNKLSPNCTAESVLHYSFKKELVNLLNKYLSEEKELLVNWNCTTCSEHNEGNLLAKTTSIEEEYNLKVCQPDIALLNAEDNVIVAIEVVVTHDPEDKVLQFYKENDIILIQINLSSDKDLNNIESKISTPNIVGYCLSPKCSISKRYSIDRKILVGKDSCGRCYHPIERYLIQIDSTFGVQQTMR